MQLPPALGCDVEADLRYAIKVLTIQAGRNEITARSCDKIARPIILPNAVAEIAGDAAARC